MLKKTIIFIVLFNIGLTGFASVADFTSAFEGKDLFLRSENLTFHKPNPDETLIVFKDKFQLNLGGDQFTSDSAVVRILTRQVEYLGEVEVDHKVLVYLKGNIKTDSTMSSEIMQSQVANGGALKLEMDVYGDIFVTAHNKTEEDISELEVYSQAKPYLKAAGPEFIIQKSAMVPGYDYVSSRKEKKTREEAVVRKAAEQPEDKGPVFKFPVNFSPADESKIIIETLTTASGKKAVVVKGRFYIWQRVDEEGKLVELQADNAVIFYSQGGEVEDSPAAKDLSGLDIGSVYLQGDVTLTEGLRTIKADELFYDFNRRKALAVNAEYKTYDLKRGIPIYVRASKIRQLSRDKFAAEEVLVTSSEFYKPQISLTASDILITDKTTADKAVEKANDSDFYAEINDIKLKYGQTPVFAWPKLATDAERPDLPIKRLNVGNDQKWGTSVETEWYMYKLLGMREPEGVEASYFLDYYSERGPGTGFNVEYLKEDYFGRFTGYIISDEGEDYLGRNATRKDIEPDTEIRGRFSWLHRQYLEHNWQLTSSFSYVSDKNFVESYYRSEFLAGVKEQNYLNLKRNEENWGLSFLTRARLNDFYNVFEEIPSGEYHLKGESVFDNNFTLYSDTEVGRFRQRIGTGNVTEINEDFYTYASHRSELDLPIWADPFKVVPYVAGAFGYDDRSGFTRSLVDGRDTGEFGEADVYRGELGVRLSTQLWKVYPDVESELFDLDQIRHIIKPQAAAAAYTESDDVFEQRDIVNFTLSQVLQTKRGPAEDKRTVDWMRLDASLTYVDDPADDSVGPDRFIWSQPFTPTRVLSAPDIFNGDLRQEFIRYEQYGPKRNYFAADYMWRISDTSAFLSDFYYDIEDSDIEQFNLGYSRLAWPDLSYYIGTRYLKNIDILDEKGSNAFTFAATYVLDPRYTLVFAQQFDFDYGQNIRSDITLIRKYHRMRWGFTFSTDASLDTTSVVFSIWPQGIEELALGPRRYIGIGEFVDY